MVERSRGPEAPRPGEEPEGPGLTQWLGRLRGGDADALDRLLPMVYEELKVLARSQLRDERPDHTLSATALVHEAYVRLSGRHAMSPKDRGHFFSIAAQAMRRVLIDHARRRTRKKRGSGEAALALEHAGALLADDGAQELLVLDGALEQLAERNPRAARVVEHRFFAGLTLEETATSLGVSTKTVQRDWMLARAWLQKEIDGAAVDDEA